MNLTKLFEAQKELGKVGLFAYKSEDRFNKLILALLVELGECANEWRGFKFWSKDQKPRTKVYQQYGEKEYTNPLLEEYVDGLHFVLELGIELKIDTESNAMWAIEQMCTDQLEENVTDQFRLVFYYASLFGEVELDGDRFYELFASYLNLGEMLGFTWEQVEQAYYEKNKINHQRQSEGY